MIISISKKTAITATLITSTLLVFALLMGKDARTSLLGETGPIEILSALAYATAIVLFFKAASRASAPVRYHLIMWGFFTIIFFGEETSWLQHYVGFDTPESIKAVNAQKEFNIHNLDFLHGRKMIKDGEFVQLNWMHFFLSAQMLFQLGFCGYFFALPNLRKIKQLDTLFSMLGFPQIQTSFYLPILISLVVCIALTIINRGDAITKSFWGEMRELIFSLGIFFYSFLTYVRADSTKSV